MRRPNEEPVNKPIHPAVKCDWQRKALEELAKSETYSTVRFLSRVDVSVLCRDAEPQPAEKPAERPVVNSGADTAWAWILFLCVVFAVGMFVAGGR